MNRTSCPSELKNPIHMIPGAIFRKSAPQSVSAGLFDNCEYRPLFRLAFRIKISCMLLQFHRDCLRLGLLRFTGRNVFPFSCRVEERALPVFGIGTSKQSGHANNTANSQDNSSDFQAFHDERNMRKALNTNRKYRIGGSIPSRATFPFFVICRFPFVHEAGPVT
ncbi:MAG: hypothetical protein R3F31_03375 [Verrucomicrobiales bacterium]